MRKASFIFLLLLALGLNSQEVFRFTYFNNYAPFSWEENSRVRGIFVDILNEIIYKRMGLTPVHNAYPWERAQLMVKEDKADGFITIPTEERLSYTLVNTEPIYTAQFTIFTNKFNKQLDKISEITTLDELKNFKVVHYLGSGWAKTNLSQIDVHWTRTLDKTLLLISLNRVDLFIDPSVAVNYNIKKHKYTHSITEIKNVLDISNFMLFINKESKFEKYIEEFDHHLKQIKEDGTMDQIISKYI